MLQVGEYNKAISMSRICCKKLFGAPAYGQSGYEVYLFDTPVVNDYSLQLETADGRPVSPIYEVQTHASCSENLLFFVFLQDY
jgi:hypothetical protein